MYGTLALTSLVPLMVDVGLAAERQVIQGSEPSPAQGGQRP